MTKKLEELLNIESSASDEVEAPSPEIIIPTIDLQDRLEEFDKISAALPRVKGLGDMADDELDALAS
jgi:hypothetical protein